MHKLSFIIGFMGLCVVTQSALAEVRRVGKINSFNLERYCKEVGGTFDFTPASYYCEYSGGLIECLLSTNECIAGKKLTNHGAPDRNTTGVAKVPGAGSRPTRGDGSKVAPGAISGLGNATKIPAVTTGSSTLTNSTTGQGVSSVVGDMVPPRAAISSTGDILSTTRTGQGIGSATGGTYGRQSR